MRHATLTQIIHGLTADTMFDPNDEPTSRMVLARRPMFVCPILAKLPGVTARHDEITPHLYAFVKRLAPELIVETGNIAVMDRWLNYDAFCNAENEEIREMAKLLHMAEGPNHIRKDNEFKVKFYTYLLARHGDVGFDIP